MDEEKKFKVRYDLKSSDPEINEYIQEANQKLLVDEASSIKQLVVALNGVAMSIVSDLNRIAQGDMGTYEEYVPPEDDEDEEAEGTFVTKGTPLIILNDDKNSKVFDRVMVLVSKVKDFKELSTLSDSLRPEIEKEKEKLKAQTIKINPAENVFETIQEAARKKNKK